MNVAPPTQGKGSPWEVARNRSPSPTRLTGPRQPRPGPAPRPARGSEEGPGCTVPSGSVPRARGRGRGMPTSPLRVTNGLGTQAHATFQPRAGLKRADTPHSTPAKAGQGRGAWGLPPATRGTLTCTQSTQLSAKPRRATQPSSGRRGQAGLAKIIRHAMSFHSAKAASARSSAYICRECSPHPPAGTRESRELLRVEYSPPPPSYAHAPSCAVQTPVYTSVHPLSPGSHHISWCTHARTRGSATPTHQHPSPHPPVHTTSMVPRAPPAHT